MIKPNFPFENFGVMLDNSRNAVMKPEVVKKYIDIMSELGYNFLIRKFLTTCTHKCKLLLRRCCTTCKIYPFDINTGCFL